MSDRPTPANGRRNQAWGTTSACPECGECLCFGCHPHGPCVDSTLTSEADTCDVAADRPAFAKATATVEQGLQACVGPWPAEQG